MPEIPSHKDLLGTEIAIEDCVVVPDGKRVLKLGTVKRLGPKMVVVSIVGRSWQEKMVYPQDLLVVKDQRVTLYLLKHSAE